MDPAALPGSTDERRVDRRTQAGVMVGDDQGHTGQSPGLQGPEEGLPERAGLAVADVDAEDLPAAVSTHTGGDHHRPGDDPPPDPGLDVGGVDEHVGELALEGPVAERLELGVELSADPRHLGLGDAAVGPQRLDQVVDLAGADTVDVGLHHHCEQGPVDPPAPLEDRREEAPGPQLRDLDGDVTCGGGDQLGAVPVALRGAGLRPLAMGGADEVGGLQLDELLEHPGQARADRFGDVAQRSQRRAGRTPQGGTQSRPGHRSEARRVSCKNTRRRPRHPQVDPVSYTRK